MTRGASLTRGDLPSCDCHRESEREIYTAGEKKREIVSLSLSLFHRSTTGSGFSLSFVTPSLPSVYPTHTHARNHESPSVAAVYARRPPIPRRSNHGNGNTSYAYARISLPLLPRPPRDTGDGIINGSVLAGYCFFDGAVTALSVDVLLRRREGG